jgi:hypothetical protein
LFIYLKNEKERGNSISFVRNRKNNDKSILKKNKEIKRK